MLRDTERENTEREKTERKDEFSIISQENIDPFIYIQYIIYRIFTPFSNSGFFCPEIAHKG